MPRVGWVLLASLAAVACTPLRTTAPETGSAGTGGSPAPGGAGTGGGGVAGTTGIAGTGVTGRGGAIATAGTGGTVAEPSGLIAFWRFNENNGSAVTDSSGNRQDLVLSTGGAWMAGHEGAAAAFDGASDVATCLPQDGQKLFGLPIKPLTFSAWVKPGAAAASRSFASAVARSHEDYAFQDFWLGLMNGRPGCTIHSPSQEGAVANAAVASNVWTHIACTYASSGVVTLYVNGARAASASSNETLGPIPTAILVGASETTGLDQYFPGAIDDVRIYSTTLTAAEIAYIASK